MGPIFALNQIFNWHGLIALTLILAASSLGYFLFAKLLRIPEISMISGMLRSSRGTSSNVE
jgi:hypothetical protein